MWFNQEKTSSCYKLQLLNVFLTLLLNELLSTSFFPVSLVTSYFYHFSPLVFIAFVFHNHHAQDPGKAEQKQIIQQERLSLEKVTLFHLVLLKSPTFGFILGFLYFSKNNAKESKNRLFWTFLSYFGINSLMSRHLFSSFLFFNYLQAKTIFKKNLVLEYHFSSLSLHLMFTHLTSGMSFLCVVTVGDRLAWRSIGLE